MMHVLKKYKKIHKILILMIFVLKFGAWRMSVFATDRRYTLYL